MTIEEKLKECILSKHRSVLEFTQTINMPYGTIASIFKRGIHNSSVTNIIKICQALGISADELAHDRIVPIDVSGPSPHMTNLTEIIAFTRRNLQEYSDLTIDGSPLKQDEIELLLDALEISIEIIKRRREREK